ncbi:MAG TPA: PHB depolymerase family esterase [Marinagarivorans sp.]
MLSTSYTDTRRLMRCVCLGVAGVVLAGCVATENPESSSSAQAVTSSATSAEQTSSSVPSSSAPPSSSSQSSVISSSSAPSSSSLASSSSSAPNLITTRPNGGAKQINVDGRSRSYNLYVPDSYPTDRVVPLVLRFHGLGGNGNQEMSSTGYRQIADQEGFILVTPSGAPGSAGNAWNVGPCCTSERNVDDVAFVKAIIEEVSKVANIDNKRIYATGFSMGGGMTHYLACHASDVIAAFAPEAFDLLQENVNQCQPARAVPLLSQRATNDNLVIYNGGEDCLTGVCINFLGAMDTNEVWKQKNECTNQTTNTNGCVISTQCTDGVEVGLCSTNSGHSPENAQRGWDFMKQFTLP